MREKTVVETYEVRDHGCVKVFTVRQEWAGQATDVEAVFDAQWHPLRVWKRMSVPFEESIQDTRLYELRNDPPTMTTRNLDGLEHRRFRSQFQGQVPVAVVGPGRALLSAWIWQHELDVGEVVRGPVLDFRRMVERIEEVALRRDPDRDEPSLGGRVRVYTVFGRESVFTTEGGIVVGDLAGLRTDESLETPRPEPIPQTDPPNPRAELQ